MAPRHFGKKNYENDEMTDMEVDTLLSTSEDEVSTSENEEESSNNNNVSTHYIFYTFKY